MDASQEPGELLPLSPAVFHILLALANGERHGYGIMQEITAATEGQMHIGPGTLYRSIKQMLAAGMIAESDLGLFRFADDPATALQILKEGLTKYYLEPEEALPKSEEAPEIARSRLS